MLRKRAPRGARGGAAGAKLDADAAASAVDAGIVLLARRELSAFELSQRLAAQGFNPEAVTEALQSLRERRYLDDERFAQQFVCHRAERGQGPYRIERELAERGVAAELIAQAIAAGPDWAQLAGEVRRRRFGRSRPETWPETARQARFLQYRGFSTDHIRSALGPDALTEQT